MVHHLLSEGWVGQQAGPVPGDPPDCDLLELSQAKLFSHNQYICSIIEIDLISEEFETFLQEIGKLQLHGGGNHIHQVVSTEFDLTGVDVGDDHFHHVVVDIGYGNHIRVTWILEDPGEEV